MCFMGAYVLGIAAALFSAWCLKKTILRGDAVALVIELPAYRMPGLRNALTTVIERAVIFLRQAGTVILLISVVLWALATYPKMPESELPPDVAEQVAALRTASDGDDNEAEQGAARAEQLIAQESLAYSLAGRAGRLVEPVFRPLGFDWKINVGIMTSFAAREVVVSTLAIVYGLGDEGAEDEETLVQTLQRQKKPDGTSVFDLATGLSLLVFFVLAMQCLPTQAVTRRETGSWKWAVFQLVYMTGLAYVAAAATYQVVHLVDLVGLGPQTYLKPRSSQRMQRFVEGDLRSIGCGVRDPRTAQQGWHSIKEPQVTPWRCRRPMFCRSPTPGSAGTSRCGLHECAGDDDAEDAE